MDKRKAALERALQDLNDMKNHEAEYAVINKYLNIINLFAKMGHVCEAMASDLAEAAGKTKEEILEEYYGRV